MKKKILLLIISVAIVTAVFTAGEYAARRFTPWRPTFQEDAQFLERFRDAWKPFFRIEKRDGRRWLVQNPRLNVFLPPQEFPLEKTPGVPRVLVLGESSAVGLGRALIDLLPTTGPAPRMEIMNCAVGGASLEITDRKFRELIRYDPDLIVLLFGHNLYVPYATISPWIYRARHFARRSALLGKLADRVFDNPREYIDVEGRVKEFEAFLARLGSETGRRGIRLVLCTAPANLMFPPRADEATRHAPNYLEALYQRIVGNDKDAEDRLAGLLSDRPAALWHFRLGEWLSARSPREAARHLVGARDLDPDRNRASTAVNGAIRSAAQGRAWLFDAEAWVAAQAPESLPGWESFQDQVHVWDDLYMKQAREIVGIWKRNNWPEEGFDFAMDGRELPKERPLWSLLSELERRGGERAVLVGRGRRPLRSRHPHERRRSPTRSARRNLQARKPGRLPRPADVGRGARALDDRQTRRRHDSLKSNSRPGAPLGRRRRLGRPLAT
jgi:hypothetical protein